ncbi:MAG: MFS transporter [Clostridium sp.]
MKGNKAFLTMVIILIASNLRGPLTMVGPLIPEMRQGFTQGNWLFGILTSIPLIVFGIISILTPKLDSLFGKKSTIIGSLVFLSLGLLIRSFGTIPSLLVGTIVLALGIGISNVLLSSVIVDRATPGDVGTLTGTLTTTMGMFAAIASGSSIALASIIGWKLSLGIFIVPSIIALIVWILFNKSYPKEEKKSSTKSSANLSHMLKDKLVWQVALFMGSQSWLAYVVFAWVPSILIDRGMSPSLAAISLMMIQLFSLPASFIVPIISGKKTTQSRDVALTSTLSLLGSLTLFSSNLPLIFIGLILIGIGQGASISFAYLFFAMRGNNPSETATLSGLSQTIGYFLASTGPLMFGFIRDTTFSWTTSLIIMIIVHIFLITSGILSGRNKKILTTYNINTKNLS